MSASGATAASRAGAGGVSLRVPREASLKRKRVAPPADDEISGFVRSVYTLLRVCDVEIAGWSSDGAQVVIFDPARFASELCPKFFRHRNFQSFTRLLNMYQFHKVCICGRRAN